MNIADYTSHDALISALQRPGEHVGEEGHEDYEGHNTHSDNEGDTPSGSVGALVAIEFEACCVPFTAHGAIGEKESMVDEV